MFKNSASAKKGGGLMESTVSQQAGQNELEAGTTYRTQ